MDDIVTTTFHIEKARHKKFKKIVFEKDLTIKAACHEMIDRWIEDYQDQTDLHLIESWDRLSMSKGTESWNSFKRRNGLDGIQDYGNKNG